MFEDKGCVGECGDKDGTPGCSILSGLCKGGYQKDTAAAVENALQDYYGSLQQQYLVSDPVLFFFLCSASEQVLNLGTKRPANF